MQIHQSYSLLGHNTFGLDVKARYFVEYETEDDLKRLLSDEYFYSSRFWHIGRGSNLLFLSDFDGIIVHSAIKGIEIIDEDSKSVLLRAGAGTEWDVFVKYAVDNGFGGAENLSLIPGEVGAAAVQNIGAYGVEVSEIIAEVHAYNIQTGEKQFFTNSDCEYDYRTSFFKKTENHGKYYITDVVFRLDKMPKLRLDYGGIKEALQGTTPTLQSVRQSVIDIRRAKLPDPEVEGNAGSFFVNPYVCKEHYEGLKKLYPDMPHYAVNEEVVKIPAAWLIDRCGLKGKTVGGAAIHDRQPLVIVNRGKATGNDIAKLAEEVCKTVKEKFSIDLTPEVNYI